MVKIINWSKTFENSDTRKRQALGWFLVPSGCDSRGYRQLMKKGGPGVTAFGVYQALCQLTAKWSAGNRGEFKHSDEKQMDLEDLSDLTRMPAKVIDSALPLLCEVGWIEMIEKANTTPEEKPKGWQPDENQLRINALFGRRETTRWSKKEMDSYKRNFSAEDLDTVEAYYFAELDHGEMDIRRRDISTLLNNWQGEADRARDWTKKKQRKELENATF